jgi:hypothetical protein
MENNNPNDQILDPNTRAELPSDLNQPQANKPIFENKKLIFTLLGMIALVILLGAIFLFGKNGENAPVSNNVLLLIKGPEELISGNETEYTVVIRNGENADLINVSLEMFYPSGFTFKIATPEPNSNTGNRFELPMVKEGKDGEVVIRGKLTGGTGEEKQIRAKLHYRLSNFNSEFSVEQSLKTAILPPNLTMDINGPVDVVNGQDTTYSVTFTNVTNQDYDNLALTISHPEGFVFSSSSPSPSKDNNYWKLPKLNSGSSATIDITGSFTGDVSEPKLVKAELGEIINNNFAPQLTSTATFRIIPSSLAITLTADGEDDLVNLGETINYRINYVNQGRIGLNNLTITVNLEGPSLDLSRLQAENAIVSGRTLTWKAATVPGLNVLSPNESGELTFSIPVTQNLTSNLKNQSIKAATLITADEMSKPTKAADVVLKLSSQMNLTVNGEYVSGAAPMQVGKSTTFAMTYLLSNSSNDVSNTKVVAALPLPPQAWKNVVIPEAEKNRLSYDSNSGKITWNIGDLPAFSGKFSQVYKVTFHLEVSPTEVDRNKQMDLLSNIQATGTDSFTKQSLETPMIIDVTTTTIDDDVLNSRGGGLVQ